MSGWDKVGTWLQRNAGSSAALVGSLLTGNAPAAIAAGVALVSSATGSTDPTEALARLQNDPATVIRLKELALQEEQNIRSHIETMTRLDLDNAQAAHREQQETIRQGDASEHEYTRDTRPKMARQAWYATMAYILVFELGHALEFLSYGANLEIALLLGSPAAAYLGFRSWDKHTEAKTERMAAAGEVNQYSLFARRPRKAAGDE